MAERKIFRLNCAFIHSLNNHEWNTFSVLGTMFFVGVTEKKKGYFLPSRSSHSHDLQYSLMSTKRQVLRISEVSDSAWEKAAVKTGDT